MAEKEYIERGALIDYLTRPTGHKATCDGCCDIDCVDCIRGEVIENLPTVDVVEVRHGRWLYPYDDKNSSWVECSECGADISKQDAWQYLYCPHCGAKMDGERKEQK